MILTPIYKFKKRELTDSPPDITANNSNWDVLETNLKSNADSIASQGKQIDVLSKYSITARSELKNVNLDDMKENGIYFVIDGCTNMPLSGIWGHLIVAKNLSSTISQEYYTGNGLNKFRRIFDGGSWTHWISLDDKIGNLSEVTFQDRGTISDLNNAKLIGKYNFRADALNNPKKTPNSVGSCLVIPFDDVSFRQVAFIYDGFVMYERQCLVGQFFEWQEIATTSKINILVTPKTGYNILDQHNYRINNIVYYNFIVDKTDGTSFAKNTTLDLCTMPSGNTPPFANGVVGSLRGLVGGLGSGTGTVTFLQDGSVYVVVNTDSITQIRISGTVVL